MNKDISISSKLEKKISKYINRLSLNIEGTEEDRREFREEMKINFLLSIKELLKEGYTEAEAEKLTFNKFGDINSLESDIIDYKLGGVYVMSNVFRFIAKIIAVAIIIITLGLFITGSSYKGIFAGISALLLALFLFINKQFK
mgnify:CR=1 FL=1